MERIKKIGWKIMWIRIGFIIFIITMISSVRFGYLTSDEESQFYIQPLPTFDPNRTPQQKQPSPTSTSTSKPLEYKSGGLSTDTFFKNLIDIQHDPGCQSYILVTIILNDGNKKYTIPCRPILEYP